MEWVNIDIFILSMIGVLEWPERSEKEKRCNSRWLRSSIAENMLLALLAVQERHLSLSLLDAESLRGESRDMDEFAAKCCIPRSMLVHQVLHSILWTFCYPTAFIVDRILVCSSLQLMCVAVVSSSMLVDPCPTSKSAFIRFVKAWCEREILSHRRKISRL